MNRRELLRTMAGGAMAGRLARAAKLTRANLCFITDEVNRNLALALPFAAEFGIQQVELRNVDGVYCFRHDNDKLKQVRAQLREHGIRVALLSTPILKCSLPGSTLTAGAAREIKTAQKDFPVPEEQQFAQRSEERRVGKECRL